MKSNIKSARTSWWSDPVRRMQAVNGIAHTCARLGEVFLWISFAIGPVLLGIAVLSPQSLELGREGETAVVHFGVWNFEIDGQVLDTSIRLSTFGGSDQVSIPALVITVLSTMLVIAMFALSFHEVGSTCSELYRWNVARAENRDRDYFSDEMESPFRSALIARMRRIGMYLIIAPLGGFATSLLGFFVVGAVSIGFSYGILCIMLGLVALSLAHVFSYGGELQREVDGLL
ncbi:hypothetical protein BMIN_0004 [Bifidobacterium minimum]|uniref:DUF2975 domain-containing protein n=1 Tax=Bifidobacterium minimum TaxID=1693 RepID=A0A087BM66_9BIFI|nr:hypothetical protein [Bifidobacterium minimum]KFI72116.1 hypothetical protein BMIN_0004 [Bifidobacterium minimum]